MICSVCKKEKKHEARGMCRKCYRRWYARTHPEQMEKERDRARKIWWGLTEEQKEIKRAKGRVANLTPEQIRHRREKGNVRYKIVGKLKNYIYRERNKYLKTIPAQDLIDIIEEQLKKEEARYEQ